MLRPAGVCPTKFGLGNGWDSWRRMLLDRLGGSGAHLEDPLQALQHGDHTGGLGLESVRVTPVPLRADSSLSSSKEVYELLRWRNGKTRMRRQLAPCSAVSSKVLVNSGRLCPSRTHGTSAIWEHSSQSKRGAHLAS